MAKIFFVLIFQLITSALCAQQEAKMSYQWTNPILNGINSYGMKDFFLLTKNDSMYVVGTEYLNPFKENRNPNLYLATDFSNWQNLGPLVMHDTIPKDAWYKDEWGAPEIHEYDGQYYFTFNSRNNQLNPYQKLGFGIAVSKTIRGPYKVLNNEKPLVEGNHGSLIFSDNEVYLYYDMDGRIYMGKINLTNGKLMESPAELLGPSTLGENYKYLDAPNITKINDTYHLLFTQFYGGYEVKIFHMTAKHPMGPWEWDNQNPLYTFLESEADLKIKMPYPEVNGFAPPTQVIFSHRICQGPDGKFLMVYHSSEKYSEPYLMIESIEVNGNNIHLIDPKMPNQKLKK